MRNADQLGANGLPAFDWVTVPAGACLIGADRVASAAARSDEQPAAMIDLSAYAISCTPVTNAQYAAFVVATSYRPPAHWEGITPPVRLAAPGQL